MKIEFQRGQAPFIYRDCLYFTEEEFANITPEQIESMKDDRYNAWYVIVTSPSADEGTGDVTNGE